MTALIPFTYGDSELRTIVIDSEPWFVAADACRMLDLRDTSSALKMVDDEDRLQIRRSDTPHFFEGIAPQVQAITVVNESGLSATSAVVVARNEARAARAARAGTMIVPAGADSPPNPPHPGGHPAHHRWDGDAPSADAPLTAQQGIGGHSTPRAGA